MSDHYDEILDLQESIDYLRFKNEKLIAILKNVLNGVESEFGGWGDIGILAEDEPTHYAVMAYEEI